MSTSSLMPYRTSSNKEDKLFFHLTTPPARPPPPSAPNMSCSSKNRVSLTARVWVLHLPYVIVLSVLSPPQRQLPWVVWNPGFRIGCSGGITAILDRHDVRWSPSSTWGGRSFDLYFSPPLWFVHYNRVSTHLKTCVFERPVQDNSAGQHQVLCKPGVSWVPDRPQLYWRCRQCLHSDWHTTLNVLGSSSPTQQLRDKPFSIWQNRFVRTHDEGGRQRCQLARTRSVRIVHIPSPTLWGKPNQGIQFQGCRLPRPIGRKTRSQQEEAHIGLGICLLKPRKEFLWVHEAWNQDAWGVSYCRQWSATVVLDHKWRREESRCVPPYSRSVRFGRHEQQFSNWQKRKAFHTGSFLSVRFVQSLKQAALHLWAPSCVWSGKAKDVQYDRRV